MAKARARTSLSFMAIPLIQEIPNAHNSMSGPLFADIERAHSIESIRKLKHLGIGQCLARIAVTGLPVLLHGAPGELEILGDAFIGAGRDKSNARCCRPYRQLHPAVARGGDMFESDPKEIIYSSRSHCVFESK
jgi:hypothetical protein